VHQVVNIGYYIAYIIMLEIMQTNYIGNSLLGDELAIAQQLISDILTCFAADVLDWSAPLAEEAPHIGRSTALLGYIDRPLCPI